MLGDVCWLRLGSLALEATLTSPHHGLQIRGDCRDFTMRAVCFVGFVYSPLLSSSQANSIDLGGGWQARKTDLLWKRRFGSVCWNDRAAPQLILSPYCKEGEVDSFPMLHITCATLLFFWGKCLVLNSAVVPVTGRNWYE